MKVLIAEDDDNTRKGLVDILEAEGYQTFAASDGTQAIDLFDQVKPDFVCLDIMMPGQSGYDVCRQIRGRDESIPIIFLSAKSEEIDKVLGLELGADDFIVKPFGVKEVIARIRAITRRSLAHRANNHSSAKSFYLADLEVFQRELRARRGDQTIELSLRDICLLELFSRYPGVALDRASIFNHCWGLDHIPNSRTLDQHISGLRKKIELDPKDPQIIKTVHGVGYRYDGVS